MTGSSHRLTLSLIIVASIFDSQAHGNDYWLLRIETDYQPNLWADRAAILCAFPLFILLIFVVEYFKLDLILAWIVFNAAFLILHVIVYFNFSPSITFFSTFLVNGVAPTAELFLVTILLLNGGDSIDNLEVFGISWAVGIGTYKYLCYNVGIKSHQEFLLVMLLLRIAAFIAVILARFMTNLPEKIIIAPEIRTIEDIWNASANFDELRNNIVWTNILVTTFSMLMPNIYIADSYDKDTNRLNNRGDDPQYWWIIVDVTTPLLGVIVSICILSYLEKEYLNRRMFAWTLSFGFASYLFGLLLLFAPHASTLRRVMTLIYALCSSNMICVLSVLSDTMVLSDDVYGLNMFILARAVALEQLVMLIASFVEYDSLIMKVFGIFILSALVRTLISYTFEEDLEGSLSRVSIRSADCFAEEDDSASENFSTNS